MSDAFLTLAKTEEGLSCFLVPRWRPDGQRNSGFRIMRVKDKLGDHSNASSEVSTAPLAWLAHRSLTCAAPRWSTIMLGVK